MKTPPGQLPNLKFGKAGAETREEREKMTAGVPLAKLIKRRLEPAAEIVLLSNSRSIAAEQFRRLKTILANEHGERLRTLVVTSAAPSEGKSMVSMNLALAFASDQQGEVLLLDADLRRPTVEHWLVPEPKLGLSEILLGKTDPEHAILTLENTPLRVLPAGTPPPDPVELLSSEACRKLIGTLQARFSRIIIDTPPIVPFTDADVIGVHADGALVVVRAGATRQAFYHQAVSSITSTKILGAVLNDVTYNLADREHYYYEQSYYKYYDKERRR